MFLWRSYIQDLDRAIRQLRLEQEHRTWIYLHRGQVLCIDDLHKLRESVGKLVNNDIFLVHIS